MSLKLEFLGTGDAFASGGRFHTCQLLTGDGLCALVDCGASTPVALQRRGLPQAALDNVVVSHLHGDHFAGLPFLLLDAAYNHPRESPLVIAGPPGLGERVAATMDLLFPGTTARVLARVPHRFVELPAGAETDLGALAVTPFEVIHPSGGPSYALRIRVGPRVYAYSGDTEWTPTLIEVADGADLFVCECFAWEEAVPSHLSHRVLAAHAAELRCRHMLLTHLGPEMLAHAGDAQWPCASDGLVVTI